MMTTSGRPVFSRTIDIFEYASAYHGITIARLLTRDRTRKYAHIRFGAMLVMREDMGLTLPRIAREFLLKDHTSVIHGLNRAAEMMENNPAFTSYVSDMRQFLALRRAA